MFFKTTKTKQKTKKYDYCIWHKNFRKGTAYKFLKAYTYEESQNQSQSKGLSNYPLFS